MPRTKNSSALFANPCAKSNAGSGKQGSSPRYSKQCEDASTPGRHNALISTPSLVTRPGQSPTDDLTSGTRPTHRARMATKRLQANSTLAIPAWFREVSRRTRPTDGALGKRRHYTILATIAQPRYATLQVWHCRCSNTSHPGVTKANRGHDMTPRAPRCVTSASKGVRPTPGDETGGRCIRAPRAAQIDGHLSCEVNRKRTHVPPQRPPRVGTGTSAAFGINCTPTGPLRSLLPPCPSTWNLGKGANKPAPHTWSHPESRHVACNSSF